MRSAFEDHDVYIASLGDIERQMRCGSDVDDVDVVLRHWNGLRCRRAR